ncbi:Uncharacterised protein [Shigella flexneri]|nr:Uncharacterised protein [Shigella flexneri]
MRSNAKSGINSGIFGKITPLIRRVSERTNDHVSSYTCSRNKITAY